MNRRLPQVEAVIFDWAGTIVDYGCFAPLDVFIEIFEKRGIKVKPEEAREPMGLQKRQHIKEMCHMDRIANLWKDKFGSFPDDGDIDDLYADFEPMLFSILPNYCDPVPGAVELVNRLKEKGIKIGSTTGYTAEMMAIVAPEAKKRGYVPDGIVTAEDVPSGRPFPWMCYQNAMNLGVYPMKHIIKVGDTISDINEGVNAGCWTVGVIKGSSELGLKESEVNTLDPKIVTNKMDKVSKKFKEAGAHFVINSIGEVDQLIPKINARLIQGE
ncbi:phosphonoacetaldehyde hydrolase [Virgibacillus halotolerans]|uniref:phosphonoacetaldehyde hydrolase n=1 Tax=Virgibacillus halotolerans TaxID=1071053 RepID=UPI00196022D0|nr:phosphonoacetaldehyde hydrolase [Virgibacillus halotolerans]MBM7599679.1 phosphonoacetaldehyde hydrolase [Virgibacillus halotolerans]